MTDLIRSTSLWDLPIRDRLELVGWDVTESGCWEWRGNRHGRGYGLVTMARHGLILAYAHRVIWELGNGPIPPGMVVRHRCDNPPCVNPDHLQIGTQADNLRDMRERGRWRPRGAQRKHAS